MKKYIINFKELRENAEVYIREVEKGKSFLVMRRSQPIFKITPVDEWGDGGEWTTVLDFSKEKRGGIPAKKLLKIIQKIHEKESKISEKSR